jgi:hypothetical protein
MLNWKHQFEYETPSLPIGQSRLMLFTCLFDNLLHLQWLDTLLDFQSPVVFSDTSNTIGKDENTQ